VEAAFFDLDKTVIARASVAAFGRPLYRQGLVRRRTLVRALASQFVYLHLGASEERLERLRDSVLTLARGWDQAQVAELVRETLAEVVEPIIFAEALTLFAEHRAAGRRVYLVSASPEEIVLPLAERLGADGALASRAVVDADGRYTGALAFYCAGPYKAQAMLRLAEAEGIDLARSFAYSDSLSDLPMLELVGRPVAVNPERALAKVARDRGWPVLRFEQPVRLRDRLPAPSRQQAAWAGAAAASLVAGVLLWRTQRTRGLVSGAQAALDALGGAAALALGSGWARLRPAGAAWRREARG
jgi:HAD superfamily hydrolase (TIGR01490 family)